MRMIENIRGLAALLSTALAACGSDADLSEPEDQAAGAGAGIELVSQAVRDASPVPAGQLLSLVYVTSSHGPCSGVLIATDTVLTAAHCFCTERDVGGNVCNTDNTKVTFQDNPTTGAPGPDRTGSVTIHPDYDPGLTVIRHDLALIALSAKAPTYAKPAVVSRTAPIVPSRVRIAGYGGTGGDCSGAGGTLHQAIERLDAFEHGFDTMRFDDPVICGGDSGGAVMALSTDVLYGIHSSIDETVNHGTISRSTTVSEYYDWIQAETCDPSFWNHCDGKAEVCRCPAGIGDCDNDGDCERLLECGFDIGTRFGKPADADICVAPGPVEGTCTCLDSDLGNVCTAADNRCSAGFAPRCGRLTSTPDGDCGGCTCE